MNMTTALHCLSKRLPALALSLTLWIALQAQNPLPRPDHTVVVIFENHAFYQIIGSADAPYINALASDTNSALFTQSFAVTHPKGVMSQRLVLE